MKNTLSIILVSAILHFPTAALAQSGGVFTIQKSVIAGGGGNSTGGIFNLDGTTGQCIAGTASTGGIFTVNGGFWGGVGVGTPTPTPTATPTGTPTATPTATPTSTPTSTPTATPTPGSGFEGDIAPRNSGDGFILSTDVTQIRRFAAGLDAFNINFNEAQRADSAPRTTLGDGVITSADVVQTRRYAAGLDPLTDAGGPLFRANTMEPLIGGAYAGETNGRTVTLKIEDTRTESATLAAVELVSNGTEAAISFTIEYDASRFAKPYVTLGSGVLPGAVLTVNDTVDGSLTILIDSNYPLTAVAPTDIVLISFENKGSPASLPDLVFRAGSGSISDGFGELVPARWFNLFE